MIKVTCAIIVDHDKILLARHGQESDHPFFWEFPGGKMKIGESEKDCTIREIREELNIDIEIVDYKMNPVQFDYGFKKIELIPFICTFKSGQVKLNEHFELAWITLPEMDFYKLTEADRLLLRDTENRKFLEKYLRENMHNTR